MLTRPGTKFLYLQAFLQGNERNNAQERAETYLFTDFVCIK